MRDTKFVNRAGRDEQQGRFCRLLWLRTRGVRHFVALVAAGDDVLGTFAAAR
jgi:hypothetical protein